jgi:hypothetical protein
VVGTDEAFFEDEREKQKLLDLYNEKAGILDGDTDSDVDLASYAFQIWKNATDKYPDLQKTIPELPQVIYSTRAQKKTEKRPSGVLVYLRTAEGNDWLVEYEKSKDPWFYVSCGSGWFHYEGSWTTKLEQAGIPFTLCSEIAEPA